MTRPVIGLLLLIALSNAGESQRVAGPIARGAAWMAEYARSEQPLNFDAVIVLALAGHLHADPALRVAFERANERQDRDRGHPMRKFFEPDFRLSPELSRGWEVPAGAAAPRVNPDRVVTEALHCRENGWRKETAAYVCGPMRDVGGYYAAHGLWAVELARAGGCASAAELQVCIDSLRAEVAAAQPLVFMPWTTLDIDLYAERLVMLLLSGGIPPAARDGVGRLLELQNEDGSWGVSAPGEPPYLRFHATMMSVWALSLAGRNADDAAKQQKFP